MNIFQYVKLLHQTYVTPMNVTEIGALIIHTSLDGPSSNFQAHVIIKLIVLTLFLLKNTKSLQQHLLI